VELEEVQGFDAEVLEAPLDEGREVFGVVAFAVCGSRRRPALVATKISSLGRSLSSLL
jgi:hypothetical protein